MDSATEAPPGPAHTTGNAGAVGAWICLGLLLAICYAPILYRMGHEWATDENMGHGFFVPAVAAWILWQRREQLAAIPMRSNPWGLVLMALGGAMAVVGTLGVEFFVTRVAFVISLAGGVLYLGGTEYLRAVAFPLFLLLFMIRIPEIVYNRVTFPLQLFASSVAEKVLWAVGIPVLREGNILELPSQRLSVVEACSGIRSLLSLSFLSLIYAYFFDSKVWMRGALLIATIPIAVGANALRVTLTGMISEYDRELSKGLFHSVEGFLVFLIALVMLVAAHQAMTRVWARVNKRR